MTIFYSSRRRGPDPFYRWKVTVFTIGAAVGLAAIVTEHDWLILVAVPVLAIGLVLRWLRRPDPDDPEEDEPDESDGPDEPDGPDDADDAAQPK
jgi:hypothetical protein